MDDTQIREFERNQVMTPNPTDSDTDDYEQPKPRQTFEIHDNGGIPFLVDVYTRHLEVYLKEGHFRPQKIWSTAFEKVFVGDNYFGVPRYGARDRYPGNTVLVQVKPKKYVFIGNKGIYEFEARKGDQIVAYASPVGNNDVPYPYAIGERYVYYLLNQATLPIDILEQPHLGYDELYEKYYKRDATSRFRIKQMHPRP
jgi:hypothetical protein